MELAIKYKKCTKCKGKKTFMCDEYSTGEYFNFCIRCGYTKKNIDREKSEMSKCQGTLRWALSRIDEKPSDGFQLGPLAINDVEPFTKWVEENKHGLDYAHLTIKENDTWKFRDLLKKTEEDYEIAKDYLFGKDIQQDPSKVKEKTGE